MFQYNRNLLHLESESAGPTPVGPGIYWSASLGLISVSGDGTTRTTIADKNIGATTVWNDGDSLTAANCGYVFQWGNNYGFPSAKDTSAVITTSSTKVDVSNYGPTNPYSSSTFISNSSVEWMLSFNKNMWGGDSGSHTLMQGPCASGFHVPTKDELQSLYNLCGRILMAGGETFTHVYIYLKCPDGGVRSGYQGGTAYTSSYLYSCTASSSGGCWKLSFSGMSAQQGYDADAIPIRPFKNDPVTPDSNRVVIYQPSS